MLVLSMPLETTVPMVVTLPPGSLEMVYMVDHEHGLWDVPEDELGRKPWQ